MFTGLINDIGVLREVGMAADPQFIIDTRFQMAAVEIGASIACSGACLTVTQKGDGWFSADVSADNRLIFGRSIGRFSVIFGRNSADNRPKIRPKIRRKFSRKSAEHRPVSNAFQ